MKNEVIQVDGKFYKKCQVVMLPTEKASNLFIGNISGQLNYHKDKVKDKTTSNQHLYFLSDEKIEKGDWFIVNDVVHKCIGLNKISGDIESNNNLCYDITKCRKIIATTDKSLKTWTPELRGELDEYTYLPRPSNEFLQVYCKANGKIDEVLVEIEAYKNKFISPSLPYYDYRFKVSPDNTITIKPAKEKMYSKKEVIDILKDRESDSHATNSLNINDWIDNYFTK